MEGQGALTGWLRRLSSGALGRGAASSSTAAAAAAAAASFAQDADAASEAGSEASSQRVSAGPSPLRAASLVASSSHRRGLSAALEDLPALSPGGNDAAGTAGPAGAAGSAQQAERGTARVPSPAFRPPRPPSGGASPSPGPSQMSPGSGLAAAVALGRTTPSPGPGSEAGPNGNPGPGPGSVTARAASPLLSRVQLLRDSSVVGSGMPLMLFPDTEEGHLAQVGWWKVAAWLVMCSRTHLAQVGCWWKAAARCCVQSRGWVGASMAWKPRRLQWPSHPLPPPPLLRRCPGICSTSFGQQWLAAAHFHSIPSVLHPNALRRCPGTPSTSWQRSLRNSWRSCMEQSMRCLPGCRSEQAGAAAWSSQCSAGSGAAVGT